MILSITGSIYAQETDRSVKVRFVQGKDTLVKSFSDNQANLESIVEFLKSKREDSDIVLEKIAIVGNASPEGTIRINDRLSNKRADVLKRILMCEYGLIELDEAPTLTSNYWEALKDLVKAEESFPSKEAAMALLDEFITNPEKDNAQHMNYMSRLKNLENGAPYRFMEYMYFPELRSAYLEVQYRVIEKPAPIIEEEPIAPAPIVVEEPVVPAPEPAPLAQADSTKGRFKFIIRTNMLYDLGLIPNIAAEIYLDKNWTITAQYHHSWWKNDRVHWYWRTYGGELTVRKYFGKTAEQYKASGHHLGINGQVFTYDFETGGRGYLGKKPTWGVGLEYGYSLPVAKRLNIDFTLGLGYWQGEYMEYLPIDGCYVWQVTKNRHYFGPTKAEVSLVWFIGNGYSNRKGGKR